MFCTQITQIISHPMNYLPLGRLPIWPGKKKLFGSKYCHQGNGDEKTSYQ